METEPRPKRRPECLSAFDLIFGLLFLIEVVLTSGARIVEITYLLYTYINSILAVIYVNKQVSETASALLID